MPVLNDNRVQSTTNQVSNFK